MCGVSSKVNLAETTEAGFLNLRVDVDMCLRIRGEISTLSGKLVLVYHDALVVREASGISSGRACALGAR